MRKKWHVLDNDIERVKKLASEAKISEFLAGILLHRGIDNPAAAAAFLRPETEQDFYDPFLMRDMEKAVKRIIKAVYADEKIMIYGDYDVDGITAVSVLYRCLVKLGAKVGYYIPDRQEEGYGFNAAALDKICHDGYTLLISVDCGISAHDELLPFKDKISFIITDHHLPPEVLPEAIAVIDPHRADCEYPDKNLAGVGVSFKLCQALFKAMKNKTYLDDIELVALGTIADIVPLIGENRRIAKKGLEKMGDTDIFGLKSLVSIAAFDCNNIKSDNVAFGIAPRLNAAGRLASAKVGVELLLTKDYKRANQLADDLNNANKDRQQIEQDIIQEVEVEIAKLDVKKQHVLVVCGKNWHLGVIGIVASRLVDKFYLPAIVISINDDGVAKGSCRSIKNFSIYDALVHCSDLLSGFGGHPMAAGVTMPVENVDAFREKINSYAAGVLKEEDYLPELSIEAELSSDDLTFSLLDELALLEPFGMGNSKPLFVTRGIKGFNGRTVGRESNHLTFALGPERNSVKAIAWNMADCIDVVNNVPFDIVYSPEINEWQGRCNVQCKLQDLQVNDDQTPLTRDELGMVYLFLKNQFGDSGQITMKRPELSIKCKLSEAKVGLALKVLGEIEVIKKNDNGERVFCAPACGTKLDLNLSPSFTAQQ